MYLPDLKEALKAVNASSRKIKVEVKRSVTTRGGTNYKKKKKKSFL